ncbi:MAG TPA: AI-2E family transporter [Thermoanaerobaculia bacterium]|nr:AI-2E family transporter [Thermoanaerobaculia bacterium]
MPTDNRFYLRAFSLAFAALLTYLLWLIFRPFLSPIVWAVLLAFILYPVNRRLQTKLKNRKGAAAGLMTLLVVIGVVAPATFLASLFVSQAGELLARVSALAARYQIQKPQDLFRIPLFDQILRWVEENTPVSAAQVQEYAVNAARSALELGLASVKGLLLGVVALLGSLLLMLFILYFFFRDGDVIAGQFLAAIPAPADRKAKLALYISEVTRAVVYGSLVTAIVQGTLVGLAFAVCGLPSPAVFGVLASVLSLLPVGGTAFVWVPGAIALASQGRWGWAIALALWGLLIVGTVDNILRPALISGRANISTLPVFFGVLGGIAAFGPVGTFLGPIVIALALALLAYSRDETLRGEPPATPERPVPRAD